MRDPVVRLLLLLTATLAGCTSDSRESATPEPQGPSVADRLANAVPEPEGPERVSAASALDPEQCRPGGVIDAVVLVRIAPGWHIYPLGEAKGPSVPTTLTGDPPAGGEWAGPWRVQEPGEQDVFRDRVTFVRPLRLARSARPGPVSLTINLGYGACDAFSCLPPKSVKLAATGQVVGSSANKEKR